MRPRESTREARRSWWAGRREGVVAAVSLAAALVALAAAFSGCNRSETGDLYGQALSGLAPTEVGAILAGPDQYNGKKVALEGKIVQECPTGCWFNLEDATGVIYVDIKPSGLAIPQHVGKRVTVEGTVVVRGQRVMVVGTGVKVR